MTSYTCRNEVYENPQLGTVIPKSCRLRESYIIFILFFVEPPHTLLADAVGLTCRVTILELLQFIEYYSFAKRLTCRISLAGSLCRIRQIMLIGRLPWCLT